MVDVNVKLRKLGVNYLAGEAASLVYSSDGHTVTGVKLRDGRTLNADLVVLASGAWTSELIPEMGEALLPTGQIVGTIQLTHEERETYKHIPVTLYMDTGLSVTSALCGICLMLLTNVLNSYCFPPNKDGIFKVSFKLHFLLITELTVVIRRFLRLLHSSLFTDQVTSTPPRRSLPKCARLSHRGTRRSRCQTRRACCSRTG